MKKKLFFFSLSWLIAKISGVKRIRRLVNKETRSKKIRSALHAMAEGGIKHQMAASMKQKNRFYGRYQ